MRPSLQNALEGHTISRRSAAAGCADAQATPQSSREALRHRLRVLNGLGPADAKTQHEEEHEVAASAAAAAAQQQNHHHQKEQQASSTSRSQHQG